MVGIWFLSTCVATHAKTLLQLKMFTDDGNQANQLGNFIQKNRRFFTFFLDMFPNDDNNGMIVMNTHNTGRSRLNIAG